MKIEDLNGIQLNQDRIYKAGFKLHVESSICREYWIGHNPLTHDYLFMIVEMKHNPTLPPPEPDEVEVFYRNGFFRLRYVHQLQNLYFALTGEELAIDKTSLKN